MPVNDNKEVALSQQFQEARVYLLEVLQSQLDELIADKLKPEAVGVPFIYFQNDPPQLAAIKKVINSLYHTEEALRHWESIDTSTYTGKAKAGPSMIKALMQVYKSIGMLDDATPELRGVIAQNYYVLEPIYSKTFEIIKKSGWIAEFSKMENTKKASKVIGQGINLLGSDLEKWNDTNPLIATFSKLSTLIETMAGFDDKKVEEDKLQEIDLIRSILDDLDNNAFLGQLTLADFEDSKAIQDLLSWFKKIQEDGFVFTKGTIEQYIVWANYYLPRLIVLTDQLERDNYLKSGLLSQKLCSKADILAAKINKLLDSDTSFNIPERVVTTKALTLAREQRVTESQMKCVQAIMAIEKQKIASAYFYKILRSYKGKSFSEIIESDRVLLRQFYSQVQLPLAHANLALGNELTAVLNEKGPEQNKVLPKTWWQSTKNAAGYLAGYVVSAEVDKVLATEPVLDGMMTTQIESEEFKITIAEKGREQLLAYKDKVKDTSLQFRVKKRIDELKADLKHQPAKPEEVPANFVVIRTADLNNLLGTLTYIQEKKLSNEIFDIRDTLTSLIKTHLTKDAVKSPDTSSVIIDKDEHVTAQLKNVEEKLRGLALALVEFENIQLNLFGITVYTKTYINVADAANELKKSVEVLAPGSRKAVEPVLKRLVTYGFALSGLNYSTDVSVFQNLINISSSIPPDTVKKQEKPTAVPVSEVKETKEHETRKTELQDELIKTQEASSNQLLVHAENISKARAILLSKFKSTLTLPIAGTLVPAKDGIPFTDVDDDPPQIAAIKKLVNSMYYAESALKIWHDIDTSSTFGKIAAAHQGVAALSQIYKSFELFTDATPEVQNLVRENNALIKPVLDVAKDLIKNEGWAKKFSSLDVSKKVGSFFGHIIGTVQPDSTQTTQTSSLVTLLSEIPFLMNNMSSLLDSDREVSVNKLRISQDKIDSISAILELVLEEQKSLFNIFQGPKAILGLIELNKKFQRETTTLQDSTIHAYQKWLEESYPKLLLMLDEIETRFYMKPGTLSAPIALEIDRISDKLNEVIESKPNTRLKKINLSFDLVDQRKRALDFKKVEFWTEIFYSEQQEVSTQVFFETLRKYSGKSYLDIEPLDRVKLRQNFVVMQQAFANSNLDIANECVIALNQLETLPAEKWVGVKFSIEQILKQEPLVQKYIIQRKKASQLKITVVDHAIEYLKSTSVAEVMADSASMLPDNLRKQFLLDPSRKTTVGPGKLQPVTTSSLNNVRGNMVYIQELKISATVESIRETCSGLITDKLSIHVQNHLKKPKEQPLHVINESDPLMVRQIKELENGLYQLQTAFQHFESMKKDDRLVAQVRALIEIKHNAEHIHEIIKKLTPELQEHYGPITRKMFTFIKSIKDIEYNKEDLQDLVFVLQSTKKELLRRNKPRTSPVGKAFFDADDSKPAEQTPTYESATKKATKLGIKYMHLASPQLENARKYLRTRYNKVYGRQAPLIRMYTRNQLGDERLMRKEMSRLKHQLQENYGFNLTTVGVISDLIGQMQRVGSQASELVGMVNKLVTDDYVLIKEQAYKELITKLSQEEDYLCLKPGTLLTPAMAVVNQLFLSAALELDMPFSKKLSILDDKRYLDVIIENTNKEIEALTKEQEISPNPETAFKIVIKKDKRSFLKKQNELLADSDINATKSALLDIQFEVYLRDQLKYSNIKKPILEQYERVVRIHYNTNKNSFLSANDCTKNLFESLQNFERNTIGDYLIVYELFHTMHSFSSRLPSKNQDLKTYIDELNQELLDETLPIKERALTAQSLPYDRVFIAKLNTADDGTSFLKQLTQLIERITLSIIEGITNRENIIYLYKQKKIEHAMQNIKENVELNNSLSSEKKSSNDEHLVDKKVEDVEIVEKQIVVEEVEDSEIEEDEEHVAINKP